MKHLQKLYEQLCSMQELHTHDIYNYTIPEAWDLNGYPNGISTRKKEIIVHPYDFTAFTIKHILDEKKTSLQKENWYKKSVIYYQITRLAGSWDHDRTSSLEDDNIYHLKDHGTFLKAILLLPMYRRMGINTILLNAPFSLGKSKQHKFANPNAIYDFHNLDEQLKDPLLGDFSIDEQYLAFEECAHHLGFHIIWQFDIGTLSKDNAYVKDHPEWFYWVSTKQSIHSPKIPYLAENLSPDQELRELVETSEDMQSIYQMFQETPKSGHTLREMERKQQCTTLPFLHDRINSHLPIEHEYTPLRFYKDTMYSDPFILRADIFPGQQKNEELWDMLKNRLQDLQKKYDIDGFYFTRIYLLPKELLKAFIDIVQKQNHIVILEDSTEDDGKTFKVDGISGNAAYVQYDVWNHQLHHFAYRLKDVPYPVFAGAEFIDSLRIAQHDNTNLTTMLHVMNQFLPNSIPFYMSGMECMEQQPLLLSYFQDQNRRNALSQSDIRYLKQPLLDDFYFEYRSDGMYTLPHLLESIKKIRHTYVEAITDPNACIPLWFSSPIDQGIGFAYTTKDSALLVIANTNIETMNSLYVHTEHLLTQLAFNYQEIHQIFSTEDPFLHDIMMDEYHNLSLSFEAGEVKFIVIK